MTPTAPLVVARPATVRHRWLPREHGGWAMVLVPLLVGVAASRPDPWHIVLAAAALSGWLASTTIQAWRRARRPTAYRAPIVTWTLVFLALGLPLVLVYPSLLLTLLVTAPAAVVVIAGARPGHRRDLANSLAQVAQALVLVPAAAVVSGTFEPAAVVAATLVAGGYLLGTVLVVRSVLRERGRREAVGASIVLHGVLVAGAALLLPAAYVGLAAGLLLRAAALPVLQARLTGTRHPLRPVDVGIVEALTAVAVVVVAFALPP